MGSHPLRRRSLPLLFFLLLVCCLPAAAEDCLIRAGSEKSGEIPVDDDCRKAIRTALEGRDADQKITALDLIRRSRVQAKDIEKTLFKLLADPDEKIGMASAGALSVQSPAVLKKVIPLASFKKEGTATRALYCLSLAQPLPTGAEKIALANLSAGAFADPAIFRTSLRILAAQKKKPDAALRSKTLELLSHDDPAVREAAAQLYVKGVSAGDWEAIGELLRSGNEDSLDGGMKAVRAGGESALSLFELLWTLNTAEDRPRQIEETIAGFGEKSVPLLQAKAEAGADADAARVARHLKTVGSLLAPTWVACLRSASQAEDKSKFEICSEALGENGGNSVSALEAFTGYLKSTKPFERYFSQLGIVRLGNRAATSAELLAANLFHEDAGVRRTAARALGAVQNRAPLIVRELEDAMAREKDPLVKTEMGAALFLLKK